METFVARANKRPVVIDECLRGQADDFRVIKLRGISIVPDFEHGGWVLIDKRDRKAFQPCA